MFHFRNKGQAQENCQSRFLCCRMRLIYQTAHTDINISVVFGFRNIIGNSLQWPGAYGFDLT